MNPTWSLVEVASSGTSLLLLGLVDELPTTTPTPTLLLVVLLLVVLLLLLLLLVVLLLDEDETPPFTTPVVLLLVPFAVVVVVVLPPLTANLCLTTRCPSKLKLFLIIFFVLILFGESDDDVVDLLVAVLVLVPLRLRSPLFLVTMRPSFLLFLLRSLIPERRLRVPSSPRSLSNSVLIILRRRLLSIFNLICLRYSYLAVLETSNQYEHSQLLLLMSWNTIIH